MSRMGEPAISTADASPAYATLREVERKVLWLATWMIHHANHVRPSRDGLKVGGHQASCASVATVMTALYFDALRPEDRVAVKPHASPVFHAIQYLLGRQTRERMEAFRALGGAQSYPSRTKDADDVDFSTGSVGLGVGTTLFASLVQDYLRLHDLVPSDRAHGRMVAVVGDAELDEGNVFEALLEGWKHDVRNLWWVIDYNRQSLDGVVSDKLSEKIHDFFESVGWRVVTLKYGKRLQAAFEGPAGEAVKQWIDDCPNQLYAAFTFKGGSVWRERLSIDLKGTSGLKAFLDGYDDAALHALMTNLGGHDMESVVEAFRAVDDDRPHCFVAYTVKGYGLPLAGHKDNHAGLMNPDQMAAFKRSMGIRDGREWEIAEGLALDEASVRAFLSRVPFAARRAASPPAPTIEIPAIPVPAGRTLSTQAAFGKILNDLGRESNPLVDRLVTTSPDVTVSTNLGGWVNHRGLFHRDPRVDLFREEKVASPQRWDMSPRGRHIELGIAENNLFLLLSALGLAEPLFGARLLPIGTLYDPFIARGLDALNYACYQGARFMVVATPSGMALAPEGGAHQSVLTPLIGIGQDGLAYFDPAYVDELAAILAWGFDHLQRPDGGSVYLRLSTRPIEQPERAMNDELRAGIVGGGYWLRPPAPGAELAIAYAGVVAPDALAAYETLAEEVPGAGLLAVTSPDRLHADWLDARRRRARGESKARSRIEALLAPLAQDAAIVTVLDGHPATLGWIGAVRGHRTGALGVERFGQSADVPDLFRVQGIDAEAIAAAAAGVLVERLR